MSPYVSYILTRLIVYYAEKNKMSWPPASGIVIVVVVVVVVSGGALCVV